MASRAIKNFFQVASLLLLLLAAALLSAITTMHFAIHGAEVQVPSLKGMTEEDARSETAGLGLNLDVDNRYYSADVAAGHILTQSPAPGNGGAPGVAGARGPESGSTEGGSAGYGGPRRAGGGAHLAARGAGSGRDSAAALWQGGRGNGACPRPTCARAGHRTTER